MPMGDDAIAEAVRLVLAGRPVAVPTETVYGLAADATNAEAVAGIYAAKGRPAFNPLIVHLPDLASAERVGLIDPLALAEGAAKGRPQALSNACIAGCAGTRRAMVCKPAVTRLAIAASARWGTTRVKGPGQYFKASSRAWSLNCPTRSALAKSGRCTISGLKAGRPLAA